MLDRMEQIRKDLDAADRVIRAGWDNFIATEPTYVLRDLIVIEIKKAREASEARIKDLEAENAALLSEAQHIAGYLRRVAELEGALEKIHASADRRSFAVEWYFGGVRMRPGDYVLMRVGPVTNEETPF